MDDLLGQVASLVLLFFWRLQQVEPTSSYECALANRNRRRYKDAPSPWVPYAILTDFWWLCVSTIAGVFYITEGESRRPSCAATGASNTNDTEVGVTTAAKQKVAGSSPICHVGGRPIQPERR